MGCSICWYKLPLGLDFSDTGKMVDEVAGTLWLSKAADQGSPDAQYTLGERYHKGRSVLRDETKAEMWLRATIEPGHADTSGGLVATVFEKKKRADAAVAAASTANERAAAAKRERKRNLEIADKLKSL